MRQSVTLEQFVAPISKALGHDAPAASVDAPDVSALTPKHVTDNLAGADLVKRFEDEATTVRVHVHHCKKADVGKTVAEAIEEAGGGDIVAAADERFESLGVNEAAKSAKGVTSYVSWDSSAGRKTCVDTAEKAAIGITFASAGVAETGSIAQVCDQTCGRSVSLLPLTHIAVVDASTIVPSMMDVLQVMHRDGGDDGSQLPSQVCFISGPSNTSDIELVRVEGVHGPMVLHYVVFDD